MRSHPVIYEHTHLNTFPHVLSRDRRVAHYLIFFREHIVPVLPCLLYPTRSLALFDAALVSSSLSLSPPRFATDWEGWTAITSVSIRALSGQGLEEGGR